MLEINLFDNGSKFSKVGFSQDKLPKFVFETVLGRKPTKGIILNKSNEYYVGEEAQNIRRYLDLRYPIEHGIIVNWDDMEKIWEYTFYDKLSVNPEEHTVTITEAPQQRKDYQERILQLLFETYKVPNLYINNQASLSLYASGRKTGLIIDSGHTSTYVVPVQNGHVIRDAIYRMDLAGRDMTDYIKHLIYKRYNSSSSYIDTEIIRIIKEKLCYVALDFEKEHLSQSNEKYFMLPDGKSIAIGTESSDIQKDLCANIVLSGGSTMIHGIEERLRKELSILLPSPLKINMITPSNRQYSAWIGGSILASLSTFHNMCVSKEEYDEFGENIIKKFT
ncbi:hypothetical protein G6F46_000710 [Rhizopus delemar]|uniref:Actin-2 n=2 Tax=Rhizopus TaxID=4842 RepID=A0A9P6YZZ3_9FUNG|nr:hypothetical protein G6F55_000601 [Rhizopus delemar]KAG1552935.1 hypothetical protein G6F51_000911 [Rhizopus arrhizus]KAG1497473.1 hypothetical protein G6F54_005741 [Rhizopus delemar]KAG1518500.1 hypothetical protein G6F53_000539 [Rhizopus delemar]KAG1519986.1 hypothetical protein G6F52_008095 [Rhizopus delemar]